MQEGAKKFIEDVAEGRICQDWKLISYTNQEDSNGLYAITIETSENDAIIAFRGSESVNVKQGIEDWTVADFGIINNDLTQQEKAASQYADEVANQFNHENIAMTGHSLGGNLALTTTIQSASDASESDIASRIKQSVSFDGPGHTEEFLEEHQEEIDKMQGVMTHYQWSFVGAILKSPCDKSDNYHKMDSHLFDSPLYKHSTSSLEFDEDGNLQPADEYDEFADAVHTVTNFIDNNNLLQSATGDTVTLLQDLAGFGYGMAVIAKNFENYDIGELEKTGNYGFDLVEKLCYAEAAFGKNSDAAKGALLAIEAYRTCYDVCKEYSEGNYRTGSKESISFGTTALGSVLASEAVLGLATTLGVAASGPAGVITLLAAFVAGYCGGKIGSDVGDQLGDWICDTLGYTDSDYTVAGTAIRVSADPLVIDFDRDGFELLPVEEGVYFDENSTGLKEKTQWIASDDALLAMDLNEDGMINDGSELFGTSTQLSDGSYADSGFEALGQYDENGDGIVDVKDSAFSRLLVWQDANSDGISQQNELYTLEELGIESISLNYQDANGINAADITFADGTTTQIGEFNFDAQLYNSVEKEEMEISEEIKGLPNIRAIGNVASLHTLMQMDETGNLKEYVTQFTQAASIEEREEIVTQMLYFITGAGQVAIGSRGGQFDAQKLTVIEQFLGKDFVGTAGRNPVNTAASILNGIYDNIFELYYNLLNGQTVLKDYLSMSIWSMGENGERYLNTEIFNAYVDSCINEGIDMTSVVAEMGRYIVAINSKNKINFVDYVNEYFDKSDYLKAIAEINKKSVTIGTEENDRLNSNRNNSFLLGLEGNDTLNGGTGDDTLYGGTGDDRLTGGAGADTYVFRLGDGDDTIINSDSGWRNDRILFGEGISPEDIKVSRQMHSLVLENMKSGDRVTVASAFTDANGTNFIGKVEFADGTVWEPEELREMLRTFCGTDGDDRLTGFDNGYNYDQNEIFDGGTGNDTINAGGGSDVLYGGEGNDTLNGGTGDDFLHGGTGNDYLDGGSGADTYFFGLGDGNDTIQNYDRESWRNDRILFGEGISPEDIRVSRQMHNLVLENTKSGDRVTVASAFTDANGTNFMGKVEFADGTVWEPEELREMLRTFRGTDGDDRLTGFDNGYNYDENEIFDGGTGNDTINAGDGSDVLYGGEGNDTLNGGTGDDFLHGGTGNDTLNGGTGNDTYFFNLGDGQDTIYNYDTTKDNSDTLCMNVEAERLQFARIGADLLVSIMGTDDSVTVKNWYYGDAYHVENIQSSDGYALAHAQVDQLVQAMASFEDVSGMSWQDAVAADDDTVNQLVSQMWVKRV